MNTNPVLNAMGLPIDDEDRHVYVKEACQKVGATITTINKMIDKNQFPPKHQPLPGRVAFWESELTEWHKLGPYGWFERYGKQQQNAA